MALIRTCAMMPAHDYYVRTDERYRDARRLIETFTAGVRVAARTTVVTIPVVVHVLHHTDEQNISDAQIASQIAALNRDYVASVQNGDVRRFDEILAPEFYCSNPDKSLVDRAAFLTRRAVLRNESN